MRSRKDATGLDKRKCKTKKAKRYGACVHHLSPEENVENCSIFPSLFCFCIMPDQTNLLRLHFLPTNQSFTHIIQFDGKSDYILLGGFEWFGILLG